MRYYGMDLGNGPDATAVVVVNRDKAGHAWVEDYWRSWKFPSPPPLTRRQRLRARWAIVCQRARHVRDAALGRRCEFDGDGDW